MLQFVLHAILVYPSIVAMFSNYRAKRNRERSALVRSDGNKIHILISNFKRIAISHVPGEKLALNQGSIKPFYRSLAHQCVEQRFLRRLLSLDASQ